MEKSDRCVVGADLAAVAAGKCYYLAVLDSAVILVHYSGILRRLVEERVLHC